MLPPQSFITTPDDLKQAEARSRKKLVAAALKEIAELEEAIIEADKRDHVSTIQNQQLTAILEEIDRISPGLVSQATRSLMRAQGDG